MLPLKPSTVSLMKYNLFCLFILFTGFSACQKGLEGPGDNNTDKYITLTANSTWNYQIVNNRDSAGAAQTFTITSTAKDTMINRKSYHIFNNSAGRNQYISITGHDYFQYDSLPIPAAPAFDHLYLKDDAPVNTSWTHNLNIAIPNVPLAIPIVITNTIREKGISRTVNNKNYSEVIHVQTAITSALIPAASLTTNIDSYYAKKYGLIENSSVIMLNFSGITENIDVKTILLNADLK